MIGVLQSIGESWVARNNVGEKPTACPTRYDRGEAAKPFMSLREAFAITVALYGDVLRKLGTC